MKKNYIAPDMVGTHMIPEKEMLNATSIIINSEKSGDAALVKGNDWDIFGEYSDKE